MQKIESVNNETIKKLVKLKQKKYRDEHGLVLVEGYKIFLEAVKSEQEILSVFATESEFEKIDVKNFCNVYEISKMVSQKLTFNVTSCDFFAVIKKKQTKLTDQSFLILDNIQDPQNLGAIIRTSVACDVKNLYLINCADVFNEKTIRASMGNVFKINFENITPQDLEKICNGKEIYCADMVGENLFELKNKAKTFGLIMGNEGNGVSKEVEKFATKTLSIPMKNNVESLNVAVSLAVILYNLTN